MSSDLMSNVLSLPCLKNALAQPLLTGCCEACLHEEPHALHEVVEITGFRDCVNRTKENAPHHEKKFLIPGSKKNICRILGCC